MTLPPWHTDLVALADAHRGRHPAVDQIAHPPSHPCPDPCPRCHLRHTGPCPCVICHTVHRKECPATDLPRPGCLACQLADDTTRAHNLADLGDGLRSPNLDGTSSSSGPTSVARPPAASPARWWTAPPSTTDDNDERGGVDTTVEAAALRAHPDRGHLDRSTTHRDEAAAWLRTALTTTGDQDRTRRIGHAHHELTCAINALHPLLPHAGTQDQTGHSDCLAHRKAGEREPSAPGHRGLCRWCYDFQRAHGKQPPPELVNRHDAGYTLSPATIAQALARKPTRKTPAKNGWTTAATKRPPSSRRSRMLDRVHAAATRITGR